MLFRRTLNFSQIPQLALADKKMTNENTEAFFVRDSSFGSSEVREGKQSIELSSTTTASLSHCVCFAGNSRTLTVEKSF